MVGWIILGSIVGLLLILLLAPVSVRLAYREDTITATAHYLFLRFNIFPFPVKKEKKEKENPPEETTSEEKLSFSQQIDKRKKTISTVWTMVKSSKRALALVKRHLVFYKVHAFVLVGGEDAHAIGEDYSKHCILVTNSIGWISQFFFVKEPVLWVHPDFLAAKCEYDISTRVRIRPIFIVAAGLLFLGRFIRVSLKQRNSHAPRRLVKKGGNQHEGATSR